MDARYTRLRKGLEQLNSLQLLNVVHYEGEMCLDEYYFDQGRY